MKSAFQELTTANGTQETGKFDRVDYLPASCASTEMFPTS